MTDYFDTSGTGGTGTDGGSWASSLWGTIQEGAKVAAPIIGALNKPNVTVATTQLPIPAQPAASKPAQSSSTMYWIIGGVGAVVLLIVGVVLMRK